ncbi:hypothetical protein Ahy_B06g083885 [Arachis hypogaea]|uniref:GRF-type domain-containing protein n=1 Tax=Arachis hypogaea TaxID=3818 RepID=A0A444YQR2_ARAHY|nr:hypothetical protein Ahy_B06g083885 [Arachis hypogaea]
MYKTRRGSSCAVLGGCSRVAIAPKCYCGVYAIMYKSRTTSNPNRVFLGCPLFKAKEPYCRYFVWMDEHLKKLGPWSLKPWVRWMKLRE